jgi:hypothetical protein
MRTLHAKYSKPKIIGGQMKLIWLVTLVLIFTTLFSACQKTTTYQTAAVTAQPVVEAEVYPPPQGESLAQVEPVTGAYPPPSDTTVPPAFLYPAYQENDEVDWRHAQAMIMNGEVERVVQTHALKVTLFLKDGRSLATVEPEIDEVLKVIKLCDRKCVDIVVVTE